MGGAMDKFTRHVVFAAFWSIPLAMLWHGHPTGALFTATIYIAWGLFIYLMDRRNPDSDR